MKTRKLQRLNYEKNIIIRKHVFFCLTCKNCKFKLGDNIGRNVANTISNIKGVN